jgi:AcrR family transcriptional regulator
MASTAGPSEGGARRHLIEVCRAHLDRQGLEGLTLRSVARQAGVSHGAPLRHFAGLGSLLAAVAAEGFRDLVAWIEADLGDAGDDPLERLRAAGRGYVGFACANPGVFELMFRHERHADADPELADAGAAAFLQLVGLVEAAQAAGWHKERAAADMAGVVWASVHGLASLWIPGTLATAVGFTGGTADLDHLVGISIEILTTPPRAPRAPRAPRRGRR